MSKKILWMAIVSLLMNLLFAFQASGQKEDKITQVAVETIRRQMRPPEEVEIKVVGKRESPIPGYYSVKLLLSAPDRDIPVVIYVDKTGDRVILGALLIKGENVTRKEAGEPKPRKLDMGQLEIEKSPFRGSTNTKVTIVEFSNFLCPYCLKSWAMMKELIEKHPKEIRYVFKHFPFQAQGKIFEISEIAAAAQELGGEAFWLVHDYMFSNEGQEVLKLEKEVVKRKIEDLLKEKGYPVNVFQAALAAGKGRKRVEEDLALGNKIRVSRTPTTILNGEFIVGSVTGKMLEPYLGR